MRVSLHITLLVVRILAFFLQVIWSNLFSKKSSVEKGKFYQLKNLLHRTSVPNDPGDNMKAAEDFLLVVLHSHVTAAAKTITYQQC